MNDTSQQQNTEDLKQDILQKIRAGEVSMKPKAYFVFKVIILLLLLVLILLTTLFLVSYTLFSIVVSGHLLLLGFGWRGIYAFMLLFPWTSFCVDIVLLFVLDLFIRRFRFGYHRPVILLFVSTALVMVVLGYVASQAHFHRELLRESEHSQIGTSPLIGPMYNNIRGSHRANGVVQGIVTSLGDNMFTITHDDYDLDLDSATTTIILPSGMLSSGFLHIGDHVIIGGDILSDGSIRAYGVTKFNSN